MVTYINIIFINVSKSNLHIVSSNCYLNWQPKTSRYTYNKVKRNYICFHCISEKGELRN